MFDTPPPGRFSPTGVHSGPYSLRPLNHMAITHTRVHGPSVLGKFTSYVVRPDLPTNVHASRSAGGVGPAKRKIDAPLAPRGLARGRALSRSRSLTLTVHAPASST